MRTLGMVATYLIAFAISACATTPTVASPSAAVSSTVVASAAPAATATASAAVSTVVSCGTFLLENPGAAGTYQLVSPTGVRIVVFRTPSSRGLPEFGTYACARFTGSARPVGGLSLTEFVSFVDKSEAGYVNAP